MEGKRVLLDLFCGRWGWSRAFAKRGWHCIGVDLTRPLEIPGHCKFIEADVTGFNWSGLGFLEAYGGTKGYQTWKKIDAIVASPPCEEFSVHGMKHFHPNPKYPANGIRLFEHTRALCEASGLPHVIENVRAAQQFVGNAKHHCGPFYLWGNAVPLLLHRGIIKGMTRAQMNSHRFKEKRIKWELRDVRAAKAATIPPELANTVAEYMERILEKQSARYSYDTAPKEK